MNFKILTAILALLLGIMSCKTQKKGLVYDESKLKIEQLTANTYRHITYLNTEDFGKVSCNGMIVFNSNEALIFDTPTNDDDSNQLIDWITFNLKSKVVGVIVTHFHTDCLGGLDEFHSRNIPSYASFKTIGLAKLAGDKVPQVGFDDQLVLPIGNKIVINEFLGEGHTADNIVSYFPSEKVLFGGCLIKTLGASKGYLGDANIKEWSNTVKSVKSKYGDAKIIIPGHGDPGKTDLLDYTINLFKMQ